MTIEKMIEVGVFIVANLISVGVGIVLFLNVRAHKRSVHSLDAKIERAGLHLRQG
jgi:hypothetical protein